MKAETGKVKGKKPGEGSLSGSRIAKDGNKVARTSKAKGTEPDRKTRKSSVPKGPLEIEWRVFLAPEHPWKTSIVLVILLGVIIAVGKYVYDLVPPSPSRLLPAFLAGALVFLLFFGLFNPYFIPVYYRLNQTEIIIKKFYYTDRREWKIFRRFFITTSGVVLSTFLNRQRFLDNFRGVQLLLPTDKDERTKVLKFIETKLPIDPGQNGK